MKTYPSSLTDSQWSAILGILDDKRKRKHSLREIFNALFYLLKTGCQWRMLPFHFPSWKLVYYSKRHIIVDTMGLLLAVVVHAANEHDSKSAPMVIADLRGRFCRLVKIVADGGYRGELIENTRKTFGWVVEVVSRSNTASKFEVLPKRWIVERTFAWLESYRRLSKDFEFQTETSQTMIQLAMIKLMLNRIRK
ncbi:MAG: IS5 family transposase [Sphingobacteriales bacterium]|nr:IS5 family transposase [Sphingobacteriales bacterium]